MMIPLQSDDIVELIQAQIQFNILMEKEDIIKDSKGVRGKYAALEQLQDVTKPLLSQVGLTLEQTTFCDNNVEYLVTTLYHKSGQYVRSVGFLYNEVARNDTVQEQCSIMTYKQRYQWRAILCLGRGSEDIEDCKQPTKFIPMTACHQNEINKIVKNDKEAIEELCRVLCVKELGNLEDREYERLKKLAGELVKAWRI